LRPQPKSAGEIARQFPGISRPAVSQHLRVLREARLITQEADGRRRLYGLHPPTLRQVDRWLARYRAFWTGRLESLKRLAERGTA
jgi:DNA-binding transcriptional ArsR family regulator